jgi:hypothetical protein
MSKKKRKINIEMVEGVSNTTSQAGLFFVHKFFERSGLSQIIDKAIGARKSRGYSDGGHIKAMVISQICGSDTIEDQKILPERVGVLGIKDLFGK